ncbi:MAG TPA: PEP-utilizing enzyme [Dehalococcoidia bacterium]|nr:PEP-utilizing enzyme [Dehalococcoidia bacterium]
MSERAAVDVAFELPDPALAEHAWELNEHMASSLAPLSGSVAGPERPQADDDGVPTSVRVNGYGYTRAGVTPSFSAETPESAEAISGWQDAWLGPVDECARMFERFDPSTVAPGGWRDAIEEQQKQFMRVFMGVHRATVAPAGAASREFTARYGKHFGEGTEPDAVALLQGVPNETSARIGALWEVSRSVRAHSSLAEQLASGTAPLDVDGEGADGFRHQLDALLARFGHTTQSGLEDLPSWNEDRSQLVGLILRYAEQEDGHAPFLVEQRTAQRREELEAQLRVAAGEGGEAAALLELLPIAQQVVPATEDHNLLADQRLHSASRTRWLAIGQHLHEAGRLGEAGDTFYLTLDELVAALEGDDPPTAAEIAHRREQQLAWRAVAAPSRLGKAEERTGPSEELRGLAASAGQHRGRAVVARSLADAQRLQHGEVLVCSASTPEWTPLFAVAGAVVTDMGGMLTHCAIVAREYGIPAVVGTREATASIPDGAMVTVEGSAGIVTIDGQVGG